MPVFRSIKGSDKMTDDEVEAVSASWSPLNRVGMPNDIGRVVAFLASQDGEWMNGQASLQYPKTRPSN